MFRRFAALFVLLAATAAPALAGDFTNMTDDERQAFRNEVRAYLLEHPEVLMEAIAELDKRQAAAQAASDRELISDNAPALFDDGYSFVGGNAEGDVTLVEFLDYRCAYCRRAHKEVQDLVSTDGNLRYIVKEFPILGEQSLLASRFAISVMQHEGPDAYAKINDALMTFRGEFTEESLRRISNKFGLDTETIMGSLNDDSVTAVIAANHALAQRLQITGTPTFVMGSQMLRGYLPEDSMRQYLQEERQGG